MHMYIVLVSNYCHGGRLFLDIICTKDLCHIVYQSRVDQIDHNAPYRYQEFGSNGLRRSG